MNRKINWNNYTYTELEFREAIASSRSYRQALLKLNLAGAGGGYKPLKRLIELLQVDTSHMTRERWAKGTKNPNKCKPIPLEALLRKGVYTQSHKLKKRLVREGLLQYRCQKCGLTDWQSNPISLHLDHINGDSKDHTLNNLRLLCPNCHSQTSTYCGKNKRKK